MGRVKFWIIVLIALLLVPKIAHCGEVEVVIDESDKKQIIQYLEELKIRRQQVIMLQSIIDRDAQQDQREKELNDKQVALITQERDIYREEATKYKKAWEDATRGRSKKCWVAKCLTLGIARCN